ncbi:olfactory receptor 14A16-like [Heteronotia binoei]|uniref:olfactory receptor 14A16-like n=1 Tax=Heteronotia binoei TaxID=13085 RepID=UPI00292D1F76|nr:olfactory receptor 14A16-like [Heteronotia binoei]
MFNRTAVFDFLLLEFSEVRALQFLHFTVFLIIYLATVTGNFLIISSVALDHHLHTPMYFFLMNLAVLDLGLVSVIVPKSMINSLLNTRHISYSGCVSQVFFFVFFMASDFCILTVMAYDRYVAICNPLHYEMVINQQACTAMLAGVWVAGFLSAGMHTTGTFATHFCSNVVNQFFCEIPQLIKLTCSDLNLIEITTIGIVVVLAMGCFVYILVTYVHIFTTVLRLPSAKGRQKALSTCLPHLIVCSTFIFTGCVAYLKPVSSTPSWLELIFTVIYSLVPPMLNPIIYSIRNKEIKVGMKKLLRLKYPSNNVYSFTEYVD